MVVLCSTVGRGYSLNKLFSENGRYATSKNGPTVVFFYLCPNSAEFE